jgi:hypothetical protein
MEEREKINKGKQKKIMTRTVGNRDETHKG